MARKTQIPIDLSKISMHRTVRKSKMQMCGKFWVMKKETNTWGAMPSVMHRMHKAERRNAQKIKGQARPKAAACPFDKRVS